jgi:ABC-2 type transport system ATP-binding protein
VRRRKGETERGRFFSVSPFRLEELRIEIKGLSKNFRKVKALHDVSLEMGEGIFGLLGQNGAGKTTLLQILATLLPQTSGAVTICSLDISRHREIRRIIGYLPQYFDFYPGMRVPEVLDYLGLLSGMDDTAARRARIDEVLCSLNLEDERRKKVKALSGGMKRRLGIAQAILHDPKVLIVDEPTAGLDPVERIRFRELLSQLSVGRIVLLSTHIVEDVEKLCDRMAVLHKGELVFSGALPDFLGKAADMEAAYLDRIQKAEAGTRREDA